MTGHRTFEERKQERAEHYRRFVFGWKERPCTACAGSGRYDHDGACACGACNDSRIEKVAPERPFEPNHRPLSRGETAAEQRLFLIARYAQPGMHVPKHRADLAWLPPLAEAERERIRQAGIEAWRAARPGPEPRF